MRALWSLIVIGTCCAAPIAAAAPRDGKQLLLWAKAMNADRYQFALDEGAQILPTSDGRSFCLLWYPIPLRTVSPKPPLIVTLHGHRSFAFDEFFLWQPYAERHGYGVLAVQWWLGGGDDARDYYAPQELYPLLAKILKDEQIDPGTAILHGFSRGAANTYALTALDRASGAARFGLTIANAGGVSSDFPPNEQIGQGVFGEQAFAGTHWVLFCGGLDPHPERDGCPAMRRTADWLTGLGGTIDRLIEDPQAKHGGFHRTAAHVNAALDVAARLLPDARAAQRGDGT
ncbi:MAG: hypothetical protein HY599_00265 [Candidatus Omnitrophica bacterium]|nr:hypothetical protein [Candidatus Omnitrophota bacterium]